jgi:hypothetical protein
VWLRIYCVHLLPWLDAPKSQNSEEWSLFANVRKLVSPESVRPGQSLPLLPNLAASFLTLEMDQWQVGKSKVKITQLRPTTRSSPHHVQILPPFIYTWRLIITCVRTRTRHRVPPTSSAIRRTRRWRRLAGSAIRKTIRRALLKTRNPTRPGETPSGRTAMMGCPRSVRPPLGLRRSKLSNTKNTDER